MPEKFTMGDIEEFKDFLIKHFEKNEDHFIKAIEIEEKINIYNYTEESQNYLKIILYQPKNVSTLRDYFEKGVIFKDFTFDRTTYESKINFPLRFMIDINIVGMSWFKIE